MAWYLNPVGQAFGRLEFSGDPERMGSAFGAPVYVPGLTVAMTHEEAAALCLLHLPVPKVEAEV